MSAGTVSHLRPARSAREGCRLMSPPRQVRPAHSHAAAARSLRESPWRNGTVPKALPTAQPEPNGLSLGRCPSCSAKPSACLNQDRAKRCASLHPWLPDEDASSSMAARPAACRRSTRTFRRHKRPHRGDGGSLQRPPGQAASRDRRSPLRQSAGLARRSGRRQCRIGSRAKDAPGGASP